MIMAAATPPAMIYQHPGGDSYRGTTDHALDLLYPAAAFFLTRPALAAIETRGFCRFRAWQQGEIVDAMVFGHGQVAYGVFVDVDDWPANASRLILECTDGRGNALILPKVCGNWSYERVRPFPIWGTPPIGEGWALPEWGGEGDTEGYGYGWGSGGYGGLGGGFGSPSAIPAAYEAPSGSTPGTSTSATIMPPFEETPGEIFTPIPPSETPPPPTNGSSTPEPQSFGLLLFAIVLFAAKRALTRGTSNARRRRANHTRRCGG
jgi:hypothetical protein